jgi:hypothetical protein
LGLGFGFVLKKNLGVVLDPVLEPTVWVTFGFNFKIFKTLKPLQKTSQLFLENLEHNPASKKELK